MNNQAFHYLKSILRDEFLAIKELFIERKLFLFAIATILLVIAIILKPFPPRSVSLATSNSLDNSYKAIADKFKSTLESHGVKANLIVSSGTVESANLLQDPKSAVDVALIQGGAISHEQAQQFYSLGSIGYEPIWIFCRKDLAKKPRELKDLARLNLNVGLGPEGGGTLPLVKRLFDANGIEISNQKNFRVSSYQADFDDLLSSKIDCAIEVSPYFDHTIQQLLRNPDITLLGIQDAKAYQMSLPYIEKLVLPAHSVDIANSIPEEDIPLIATTTTLAVSKDVNEDIQTLLLVTMRDVLLDTKHLFFAFRGEFPKYLDPAIPISPVARSFYNNGTPPLFNNLPFWLAGFLNRLWLFILTAFALLYPLAKLNMKLRSTNYDIKQHPHYEELLSIERKVTTDDISKTDIESLIEQLDSLNKKVIYERIPFGMENSYFIFLNAIHLVRYKIIFKTTRHPTDSENKKNTSEISY